MSKGLSPLVATVLLIAVTMSIAGVILFWSSSFVGTQTNSFNNQSLTGECKYATFEVNSCSYDPATTNLAIILNNNGNVNLKSIAVYVQYPDGSLDSANATKPLPANSLQTFYFSGIYSNYTKVIIRTQCPDVSRETLCK